MTQAAERTAFYNSREWRALRRAQLEREPHCRFCAEDGRVVAAKVADHIEPRRTAPGKALDIRNLQSLCRSCHSGMKRFIEEFHARQDGALARRGLRRGTDGWIVR